MKFIFRCKIFLSGSHGIAPDWGIVLSKGSGKQDGYVLDAGKYQDAMVRNVGARLIDLDGIVCPALINTHTHLELSPFKSATHSDFVDWVLHLMAVRTSRQFDDLSLECLTAKCKAEKSGTSYFVNVGNDFALNASLGKNQLFQFEQIGINESAAEGIFTKASASLSPTQNAALAIHAPYSTSPSLMKKIKSFNNARGIVTSVHLAETEDEVEFIHSGTGRMTDLLDSRLGAGKWSFGGTGLSPVAYLDSLGLLDEKTLCVHCVFLEKEDLEILKKRNCGVVVCVRSNRNLTGSIPNLAEFAKHGIRIFIGTDSKASSPDLDMFAEISAFYGEYHGVLDPSKIFQMVTTDPSNYLGIDNVFGELAPGKIGSMVFAPFDGNADDAFEFLVADAMGKTETVSY